MEKTVEELRMKISMLQTHNANLIADVKAMREELAKQRKQTQKEVCKEIKEYIDYKYPL